MLLELIRNQKELALAGLAARESGVYNLINSVERLTKRVENLIDSAEEQKNV